MVEPTQLWMLVIAVCALAGWWLAVRPGSSYRGVSSSMSCLIVVMAVLMCALGLFGQRPAGSPPPPPSPSIAASVP